MVLLARAGLLDVIVGLAWKIRRAGSNIWIQNFDKQTTGKVAQRAYIQNMKQSGTMKGKAMKSLIGKAALAGLLALGAGAASAGVTVNYVESDKFSDLPFAPWERKEVLDDVAGFFAELGKSLPAGQDLTVDITDIDLAGREYPNSRGARDLRVLKGGADWPIMELRYTLSANGQVLTSGNAKLTDMNYMNRINRLSDGDRLRYEKRMIEDWFNKTILQKKS
jgi:hypothetical protein